MHGDSSTFTIGDQDYAGKSWRVDDKPPPPWPYICVACSEREPIKTDGAGRALCERCALSTPEPFVRAGPRVSRNDACPCGSGKKRKRCCR
jgi:hypothetical protein